ncbi:hypothetical protein evm_002931 [Chilo suppressalis]|nr:hypothetical protein evm_002931 [Chilo suppressalis]
MKEQKENVQLSNRKKSGPKLTFKDKIDDFDFSCRKFHQFFYEKDPPTIAHRTYQEKSSTFKDKIDDFDFSAIRRKVHQFFYEKDPTTIAKVHQVVNNDPDLPNMSKSTMQAVLKHLKFKYGSRKRRSCLTDRQDLILWRRLYLTTIKKYRRQGKIIYYQDETWINEGHITDKVWVDTTIESSKQAFSKGVTIGLKSPTGKGRRLIISHIGSDKGFVEAGLLIFESKKNSMDYQEEMNSECFEEWLKRILPNLKPNALDNAPYHSRKVERIPTSNWRKADIIQWLDEKQIQYQPTMIKAQLIEIVKLQKTNYERFAVEELAAEYGVSILRLPPYHCELNPIELV